MPFFAPAAAAAAAPAAAGKGAATAGTAAAAGAGAGAAGKGGLGAFLGSPTGQILTPALLGVIAGQNPQSATGVRTALGAFDVLQGMQDRESVAKALAGYSESVDKDVRKEIRDREMNEAVLSVGGGGMEQLAPGGPFVGTGVAPTKYEGAPTEQLEQHRAAVGALPALGRVSPHNVGYLMADLARRGPTPAGPPPKSLYAMKEEILRMFPGHNISADMTREGITLHADTPIEPKPSTDPPTMSDEQLTSVRRTMGNLPPGVQEQLTVLGPSGAKRTITGRGITSETGGAPGTGAGRGLLESTIAGVDFFYDPQTKQFIKIPPEVLQQFAEIQALKETQGIAGTVVRNPDGTLTIRR